ncbi:Ammonia transporter [Serratia marcescens]|uniref:Ammonium transporter n=1 Tax=Serratia marcescens TaxID=615 RepID=A0A380APN2_SERMA|nr:Ammonia transporter [Serratia marcescens]
MKRLLSMLGLSSVTLVPSLALAAPAVADKADNAFMMICTALVLFMTLPGIALFYGGLLRGKNVLSMLTQVTVTFALVCVLWVLYGYSLAFSEGNAVFGGFETAMLKGIGIDSVTGSISQMIHVAFQASFACITVALVVGGFAERIRFSAVLIFAILWFTLSYLPIAHMVWGGGYLAADGALDFAGGTVVHINAASAGLIGAYLIGKRAGFGKEAFKPHNLPMVFTGASILYIGWFGFNAGSASAANGIAALAFLQYRGCHCGRHSLLDLCRVGAARQAFIVGRLLRHDRRAGCSDAGGGHRGGGRALIIGLVGGVAGLWGVVTLKKWLKVDDTCDVFGVHGVCGIVGCLLTGVFTASSLGGTGYAEGVTMGHQVWIQLVSVLITLVWSSVAAFIAFKIAGAMVGLRVPEEQEREGLDVNSHGESAYNQ